MFIYNSKKLIYCFTSLLLLIGIIGYIFVRTQSIISHLQPVYQELADMLYYKRNYSYDQKMLDLMGESYRAIMLVRDATPPTANVYADCLDFRLNLAQAILYPRRLHPLERLDTTTKLPPDSYLYQNHEISRL